MGLTDEELRARMMAEAEAAIDALLAKRKPAEAITLSELEFILATQLLRGAYINLAILLVRYAETRSAGYKPELVFSLSTIIVIPLVFVFPFIRRYIVSGFVAGSLKG